MDYKEILYTFKIDEKTVKYITLKLKTPYLELINESDCIMPEWARLSFHKCPNCKLDDSLEYCPVAKNMVPIIEEFKNYISHEKVYLTIFTLERIFEKIVTIQDGLSSLLGIIMTTSGCSHLDKLRPMVMTHLPFATGEETTYRVLSMYTLAQYYRKQKGLPCDEGLKGLVKIYKDIEKINSVFIERFRGAGNMSDAHLNALVKLSCFNFYILSSAQDTSIIDLEPIFHPYF
jgi:hypothetical protein